MTSINRSFLTILFVCVGPAAHAQTFYDDVKALYAATSTPAVPADFDRPNGRRNQQCVEYRLDAPNTDRFVKIRLVRATKPGFEGIVENRVLEAVVYSDYSEPNGDSAERIKTFAEPAAPATPTQLVTIIADQEQYKNTLRVRKASKMVNGKEVVYLPFERTEFQVTDATDKDEDGQPDKTKTTQHYGFCFTAELPTQASPLKTLRAQ